MKYTVLKIKDWLKFRSTDYDGFIEHLKIWEEHGIPHGFKDLIKLARNYNVPTPRIKIVNGQVELDFSPIDEYLDTQTPN